MKKALFGILVASLLVTGTAQAEMYKWVDKQGVVTFKDTPPPPSKKRTKVKIYRDDDFDPAPPPEKNPPSRSTPSSSAAPKSAQPPAAATKIEQASSKRIEMFMTDWCSVCKQAQQYLNSRNYPYLAYDIEKDKSAMKRFQELGGRGVPLILVGDNRMSGFSPETLERYLGNN